MTTFPDPLNVGWTLAWKQMADQLAEVVEGLLSHFGENQAQAARTALEAHEDLTSYDEHHGTGRAVMPADQARRVAAPEAFFP